MGFAKYIVHRIQPMNLSTSILRTTLTLVFGYLTLSVGHAQSIMVTTAEGPTSFNTTLGNVNVESFSGMTKGISSNINWNGVGTIDKVSLIPNNQYGGTPTSKAYPVQSTSASLGGVSTTTITLSTPSSYFGMFWSAGDASNNLSFYNGNSLVASFSTQSLMNKLPSSYYGNPNPANLGQDRGEPFGFINFLGGSDTKWDKIVLSNPTGSGFESQNWTSRTEAWSPMKEMMPGKPMELIQNYNGVITTTSVAGSTVSVKDNTVTLTAPATANSKSKPFSISFAAAAPAAPAPPLPLLLAFGAALVMRSRFHTAKA